MTRILIPTLLCALLLAGCASPNRDSLAPAAASNATSSPTSDALGGAAVPLDPVAQPVDFDGRIPAYVNPCVYAVIVFRCQVVSPTQDFSKIAYAPEFHTTPRSGALTASWTSAVPTNDKLVLAAYSYDQQGGFKSFGFASGPSPLTLHVKSLDIPQGQRFVVGLFPQNTNVYALPVGGGVSANAADQSYHLTGQFLVDAG